MFSVDMINSELSGERFTSLLPEGQEFLDETKRYFSGLADKVKKLEDIEEQIRTSYLQSQGVNNFSQVRLTDFTIDIIYSNLP